MEISQKIIDYAIWYYLKYYPSRKKLAQKLQDKFGPESENGKKYGGISKDEIEYILSEKMRNIIQEQEVLRAKIMNLQNKGKNINYITNNLLKKQFKLEEINQILQDELQSDSQSILKKDVLYKKIENYKNSHKSKNYIRQKFIERSEDKEVVEEIIENLFLEGDELLNLKYEYEKIRDAYDKNKIIEKLMRKGFQYDDLKKIINN